MRPLDFRAFIGAETSAPSSSCCCSGADLSAPRSELADGTRVAADTARRLACDASVVRLHQTPEGSILDIGRKSRTIPPALRRALEARDRGCRFPGCGLRYTDAHHVEHWADGGETKLENLVLLCRHHHRLVHEEGWTVKWWGEGWPVFFDPRGGTHFDGRWEMPALAGEAEEESDLARESDAAQGDDDPVSTLITDNRRRGTEPDGWTAASRWEREEDIPASVFLPAVEAMGES